MHLRGKGRERTAAVQAPPGPVGGPCQGCERSLPAAGWFALPDPAGPVLKCLRCALLHRPMLVKALRVALVVGTLLALINQGDLLFAGQLTPGVALKLGLTYLVPFGVSVFAVLANSRSRGRGA